MTRRGLVAVLAYNEAPSIAHTIRELTGTARNVDVLVVDDGSTDGTAALAREAGAAVLRHPVNLGVSTGEASALAYALRHGFRMMVRVDGDGQHDPACVKSLMDAIEGGADLVIGSRFAGTASYTSTGLRRLGIGFLSRLLSSLIRMRVTDPTSGFRGFSRGAMRLFSRTYPHEYPEPESVLMASRSGLVIREVPVRMRPRFAGRSSLSGWGAAFYVLKVCTALSLEFLRSRSR